MPHDSRLLLGEVVPRHARLLLGNVEQCREPTRAALALRASLGARGENLHGAGNGARQKLCAAR